MEIAVIGVACATCSSDYVSDSASDSIETSYVSHIHILSQNKSFVPLARRVYICIRKHELHKEIDMQISLSFRRILLEAGKTFSFATVAGARLRVLDGMVWATTSASPHDVWLRSGEEHTVTRRGLTVIESVTPSTVELIPPSAVKPCGRILNRFDVAVPKLAFGLAAVLMTATVIGLLVVLPASVENGSPSELLSQPGIVATTPARIVASGTREANEAIARSPDVAARPTSIQ
jgi:hypothetical protein